MFQFGWQTLDSSVKFHEFVAEAFKNAGIYQSIITQPGMQLIYMASKGKLRFAHKILTYAPQKAADNNCNHLPDDIIQSAIDAIGG